MREVFLVCEGEPDGIDKRFLDAVLVKGLGVRAKVVASHSDTQLSTIRRYLEESRGGSPMAAAIAVQDRNYAALDGAEEGWNREALLLTWTRHEIENYMVEPDLLLRVFQRLSHQNVRYADRLPTTSEETRDLLQLVGRALAPRAIVERVCWTLKAAAQKDRSVWFKNLTIREDWDEQSCLHALLEEGHRCRKEAGKLGHDTGVYAEPAIRAAFSDAWGIHNAPAFWSGDAWLRDLPGHELMSGLLAALQDRGFNMSLRLLEDEVIDLLTKNLPDGIQLPTSEFKTLANRLNALAA